MSFEIFGPGFDSRRLHPVRNPEDRIPPAAWSSQKVHFPSPDFESVPCTFCRFPAPPPCSESGRPDSSHGLVISKGALRLVSLSTLHRAPFVDSRIPGASTVQNLVRNCSVCTGINLFPGLSASSVCFALGMKKTWECRVDAVARKVARTRTARGEITRGGGVTLSCIRGGVRHDQRAAAQIVGGDERV